jgi:hypothetical protein
VTAASTTADPLNYRKPQARFDPTAFEVVGGVGRGGSALIISKEAEKRLHDKQSRAVVMGSPAGIPRSGMQMTAWGSEFLGWNTKWVVGYRGTNELMLALERGEIDMTSTANLFLLAKLIDSGRFKILVQTGTLQNGAVVPRPDFGDAPILASLLKDRITDPQARAAFGYWSNIASMDKWLALPPRSPPATVSIYRETYRRMIRNPEFIDRGKKTSDDFVPLLNEEVEPLIRALGNTPPGALSFLNGMFKKQGLSVE